MSFFTHRDYFRMYELSAAQYGEILIAQVFRGRKLGDSHRCYDVAARPEAVKAALSATGTDPHSWLWPKTQDDVRIEVKSKLSQTSSGRASVIWCKDSNLNGIGSTSQAMTHFAVVIVHPGSRARGNPSDEGRIVNAWLLTRDAAEKMRARPGKEQYIPVSQLAKLPASDGVISITSLVAAAAEAPLEFLRRDDTAEPLEIRKTAGVCGGSASVGNTRIPVWTLWRYHELGLTDKQILEQYPSLTQQGLSIGLEYAARNPGEIAEGISRARSHANKERATA